MTKANYALVLKSGEIVRPDPTWSPSEDGSIKVTEYFFYWVGRSYDIGTFPDFEMALDYIEQGIKGVWLSPFFGNKGGRWIPVEDIKEIMRIE